MKLNRRRFLKRATGAALASPFAAGAYSLFEASWCQVVETAILVPALPEPFRGTRIAFVADTHHGPNVSLGYVRSVVELTNTLKADIVALGGDYVSRDRKFIAPGIAELGRLHAPMGRFAVLGNHDHWVGLEDSRAALDSAGIISVVNRGEWLERRGTRLRICGVDDYWEGAQDLASALGDATRNDATILLSHNPDYAEDIRDDRVGLVLSGHTHGGQVVLPFCPVRWAPTEYGAKYLGGLAKAPVCNVYVSRGTGTSGLPVRFRCRPEITLITLVPELRSRAS
jgi:predicted MPP superfamily phosphohydrolase